MSSTSVPQVDDWAAYEASTEAMQPTAEETAAYDAAVKREAEARALALLRFAEEWDRWAYQYGNPDGLAA